MALDEQLTEIIAAVRRQITAQFDERMAELAAEISQAASADRTAAIRDVRLAAEADIITRSQEAVVAAQAESTRRTQEAVAAVRVELEQQIAQAVSAAQAEADQRLAAAVAAAQTEADQRLATAVAAAQTEADQRLAAAVAAGRQEAEQLARQTASDALADSHVAARQSEIAQIERVADAVRRFDGAQSLTDVLDALGDVTSREAPRVALFLVRGSRLAGWRATGFTPDVDARSIDVPNDESSLLWRAVRSGQPLNTTDAGAGDRVTTPFGEMSADEAAVAVPVRVGGETVAVIYADNATDAHRDVPSAWPEVVEVMGRHAGRCLEVLTLSRTVPPVVTAPVRQSAPRPAVPERHPAVPRAEDDEAAHRYARLLVSEIKLYHEAAVTEGRHEHNLADRLRTEIDRARVLYEQRVPVEIRNRVDYFGQELVRTLANGDPALLGTSAT